VSNLALAPDHIKTVNELWGSLLLFCKVFFPLATNSPFYVPEPPSRKSHVLQIIDHLEAVFRGDILRLYIGIPPGHGKSKIMCMFVAWAMSRYPDCEFIYISYSKVLAAEHTDFIRTIMNLPEYVALFGVRIRQDRKSREFFKTTQGGAVAAFGTSGSITGFNAGKPFCPRFSGGIIIDDPHNSGQVLHNAFRLDVINKYRTSISQRPRGENVPIIGIAQRTHMEDLINFWLTGQDIRRWHSLILKALDVHDNPLHPAYHSKEYLLALKEKDPYVFACQHQQDPVAPDGVLFNPVWFPRLDTEPSMFSTFITIDTAETSKTYNDATVFSFWGVYDLIPGSTHLAPPNELDMLGLLPVGLHSIGGVRLWVEPKDLLIEFERFYRQCLRYPVPPLLAAIEKKSTGTTMASVLEDMRGLEILKIERTSQQHKGDRFLAMQKIIASKLVSFTAGAKHVAEYIDELKTINPACTHAHDDITDTMADAVQLVYLDPHPRLVPRRNLERESSMNKINAALARQAQLRRNLSMTRL